MEFKVGDVVQLKSGSPPMTIERRTIGTYYRCTWSVGDEVKTEEFSADMLKIFNLTEDENP